MENIRNSYLYKRLERIYNKAPNRYIEVEDYKFYSRLCRVYINKTKPSSWIYSNTHIENMFYALKWMREEATYSDFTDEFSSHELMESFSKE